MRSESLALAIGCAVIGAFLAPSLARAGGQYTSVYDVTAASPAVIAEKQPDNSYVYYIREPGGELICRVVGSTKHYYHFDELGSTRAITDDSGSVTDRYSYDAYGSLLVHDRNAGSIDQPYQYVGQLGYYTHYQAPEFGRLQLGVRFYDPEAGRFERRDPVPTYGTAAQAYVRGSPVVVPDPSGLYPRFNCPRRTAGALAIEAATRRVCDALSTGAIDGCIGCTTGPRQLQCLKDFCSRGVVQCGSWECVHGWPARPPGRPRPIAPPCGFTYGSIGGQQRPGETVVICGTALGGRCPGGAAATLLHEMMHVCGSRNETAAENKMARCFRQLGWRL